MTNAARRVWIATVRASTALHELRSLVVIPLVFAYGAAVYLASYAFGTTSVCGRSDLCPGLPYAPKEVGYGSAVNWLGSSLLLLPCLIFFVLESVRTIPATLDELGERGMLVDAQLRPIGSSIARKDWESLLRAASKWMAPVVILSLIEPAVEWFETSGRPLILGALNNTAEKELDWSVAALLRDPNATVPARLSNALFSLLVFADQSLMIYSCVFLLMLTFLFCYFLNTRRTQWRIIPSRHDKDVRKGFQLFEEPITQLIGGALLALGMFYLSVLQNSYIRTTYENLRTFVVDDVLIGMNSATAKPDWTAVRNRLANSSPTNLTPFATDFSADVLRWAGLVVILLVLGAPLYILRGVAMRGRNIALATPGSRQDDGLLEMKFWPLSYVSLNLYLVLCVACGVSLVYYRVGVWVFGMVFGWALIRITAILTRNVAKP